MFDSPSEAKKIEDIVKRIADHSERINSNMQGAAGSISKLNTSFRRLLDNTAKVNTGVRTLSATLRTAANRAASISRSMGTASRHAKTAAAHWGNIAKNANTTSESIKEAAKHAEKLQKKSKKPPIPPEEVKKTKTLFEKFKEMVKSGEALKKVMKGIVLITGFLVYQMAGAVSAAKDAGLYAGQILTTFGDSLKDWKELAANGWIFNESLASVVHTQVALQSALGGTGRFSGKLVQDAVSLHALYNMSIPDASKLTEYLYRWSNDSEAVTNNTLKWAAAVAKANNMSPGDLLSQMVQDSEELARAGAEGAQAFAKQEVILRQMGVSMKTMAGFSDRLVDNFSGTLEMTAKLQTFLPGLDLSKVMYAAQFNPGANNANVAIALRDALRQSGLKDLNQLQARSLQNMLAQSLGMSTTDIENLITGKRTTAVSPGTKDLQTKNQNRLNSILGLVQIISDTLQRIFKYLTIGFIARGLGFGGEAARIAGGPLKFATRMAGDMSGMLAGAGGLLPKAGIVGGGTLLGIGAAVGGHYLIHHGLLGGLLGTALQSGGGALSGASLGSMLGPEGALVGAVIGGVAGLATSLWQLVGSTNKTTDAQKNLTDTLNDSAQKNSTALTTAANTAGVYDLTSAMQLATTQQKQKEPTKFWFSPFRHAGGTVPRRMPVVAGDISPGDSPVTLKEGETVLTPDQMSSLAMAAYRSSIPTSQETNVNVDTTALESKIDNLIHLMKAGGIAVNLDGRRVSTGLVRSNRYG